MKIEDILDQEKKAIEFLNRPENYSERTQITIDRIEIVVAALEKQIAKDAINTLGHQNILEWRCPVCKEEVAPNVKYCDECGQALNWPGRVSIEKGDF